MKTRTIVLGLAGVVTLAVISTNVAYHRGYRRGVETERACWKLNPASIRALFHGEVTARRDTTKHPLVEPPRMRVVEPRGVNLVERL